jgi:hypothetical protein
MSYQNLTPILILLVYVISLNFVYKYMLLVSLGYNFALIVCLIMLFVFMLKSVS